MAKRFAVGIDLGTSNSALALAPAGEGAAPEVLPVPQLFSFQAVGEAELLPSVVYLPLEKEAQSAVAQLPWAEAEPGAGLVGQFAREHGAQLPDRLVSSAKSWLCSPHVDPLKPILPWKAELDEARKLSPLQAAVRYLEHLRLALQRQLAERGEDIDPAACEVVVTVPASFDEVARSLTHLAAEEAGWGQVTLLEEQQAAFYYWIAQSGDAWREQVSPGDLVLVCDVGGGTADFSLVAVSEQGGDLQLERVSVGDHILLGGDNMDLALAYALRAELEQKGQKLDNWQFLSLVHSCRVGKERLLADAALAEFPISIASRGASLFAGTITAALRHETVDAVVLDGYFPRTGIHEHPARRRALGLQEFGLDYAADPALSKHLAFFLARSFQNTQGNESLAKLVAGRVREGGGVPFICPTAVLFNGGVFKAEALRERILELLAGWNGGEAVAELPESNFDLAVAKGAAVYARTRLSGEGIRIKAGTARSYYIGLESSMPAVPGLTPPLKALCVVPQGMEEGSEIGLPGREFGLITGEQVEFRFFSSSVRAGDEVGAVVDAEEDLEETASLQMTLPPLEGRGGEMIPVHLHSVVTPLGTLELWMRHEASGQQWKLEFNVRGNAQQVG
ncbi:heat-shock protein [Desulfuromonas versatilis]|uniref:Heat-shock protein n=1 Tax=Desulfuromonas versatilis TaxID=2802975 RepID=A0ABM9SDA7_9BACT|nr:Hsp70 family protein [Desulfuromonas versatilis]BCR03235.1 heat-shock protein [Desulfuromonas versatilis]